MSYLLDPHDGVIKLRVYRLQVFQRRLLVQHTLVERQREAGVDELSVVERLQGGNHNKKPALLVFTAQIHKDTQKNTASGQ